MATHIFRGVNGKCRSNDNGFCSRSYSDNVCEISNIDKKISGSYFIRLTYAVYSLHNRTIPRPITFRIRKDFSAQPVSLL